MNRLESITTKLQPKEIEILKKYCYRAREEGIQHFHWEKLDETLRSEYPALKALNALGFVRFEMEEKSRGTVYDSYFLTLFPASFHRADFENLNGFRKRITKIWLSNKEWTGFVAFIVSLVLAVLKIIEFFSNP